MEAWLFLWLALQLFFSHIICCYGVTTNHKKMQEFLKLQLSTLVDMLADHTARYMSVITDGTKTDEEFIQLKEKITQIQLVILMKKELVDNMTISF